MTEAIKVGDKVETCVWFARDALSMSGMSLPSPLTGLYPMSM